MNSSTQRFARRLVHRRGFGDWLRRGVEAVADLGSSAVSRISEAVSSLFGDNRLVKSFRDTLKTHRDKKIVGITVVREPLERAVAGFANVLTGGKFEQVARQQGEAGFFHLYSILELEDGTKLLYERNERPVLSAGGKQPGAKAEMVRASGKNIMLSDFIENAIKASGGINGYVSYDPLRNNCQKFLIDSFRGNGILTPELISFIQQDLSQLIEETPSFSKYLAEKATSLGGKAREVFEELFRKKGGRIIKKKMIGGITMDNGEEMLRRNALPIDFGSGMGSFGSGMRLKPFPYNRI